MLDRCLRKTGSRYRTRRIYMLENMSVNWKGRKDLIPYVLTLISHNDATIAEIVERKRGD